MRIITGVFLILCFSILDVETMIAQKVSKNQLELQLLTDNVFSLSEVMLHDVANPPAASRFYSYAMLGAYETVFFSNNQLPDLNIKLNLKPDVKPSSVPKKINIVFCANYAMLEVGRQLMPSGSMLAARQKALIKKFSKKYKLSKRNIEEQVKYSSEIANQVVKYAKTDNYNKLSTYKRYTPSKQEGHWYPTPPEYMAPVEPNWKIIRPFFLDSANQFKPNPPAEFSKDSTSIFYKQMMEVYNLNKNISEQQIAIANFWDCNPFAVAYSGHLAIGLKKISPGGHWMGITGIVCKQADIPFDSAILAHALVAFTLQDAFISCWQEKYFSDRIRPEAAINKLLDPSWRPILQTPPFPEYTSGHSVASSSVAVVLTHLLGNNFEFVDTSEIFFGLPARQFKSFYTASDEAAISRLYGGIHFRDACEEGIKQGMKIGNLVIDKFKK
jgi:hypothetical protein